MKPVNEMTDQELNEWVAYFLGYKEDFSKMGFEKGNSFIPSDFFNPCTNLNLTHLMEEKIREMGKGQEWAFELCKLIDRVGTDFDEIENAYFDLAHASARQRCEAAFLAFGGKGE